MFAPRLSLPKPSTLRDTNSGVVDDNASSTCWEVNFIPGSALPMISAPTGCGRMSAEVVVAPAAFKKSLRLCTAVPLPVTRQSDIQCPWARTCSYFRGKAWSSPQRMIRDGSAWPTPPDRAYPIEQRERLQHAARSPWQDALALARKAGVSDPDGPWPR